MAQISKITLPSGTTYDLKDAEARLQIQAITGGSAVVFVGVSTTQLTDGGNEKPTIDNSQVTPVTGQLFFYGTQEFIYGSDSKWHALGSLDSLGSLAYKNNASTSYTPTGSVSQPTFSGSTMTSTGNFTPSGSVTISTGTGTANYTPEGSVSAPTITVTPSTGTVNSITNVGTLPSATMPVFTTTVTNENLTIGWADGSFNAGTLPTKGSDTTVVTGITSATSSQPTFTGTGTELKGSFSGTSGNVSVSGTPQGTVSQPSFSGTQATVTVS